jgi:hypothetical protein
MRKYVEAENKEPIKGKSELARWGGMNIKYPYIIVRGYHPKVWNKITT